MNGPSREYHLLDDVLPLWGIFFENPPPAGIDERLWRRLECATTRIYECYYDSPRESPAFRRMIARRCARALRETVRLLAGIEVDHELIREARARAGRLLGPLLAREAQMPQPPAN